MQLWEILVPCEYNTGKPVRRRHHKEWDKRVRRLTSGLTIFPPAKGQWVCPKGALFEDRMIPVRITCDEQTIEVIAGFGVLRVEVFTRDRVVHFTLLSDFAQHTPIDYLSQSW